MKTTILIADDHAIVREGLRRIVELQPDMTVVGEAKEGRDAVSQTEALQPNIVIMDIAMPMLNGIEATRAIRTSGSSTRIIMLSMHHTTEYVHRAIQAGAQGYILKESAGSEVVNAIREVMNGNTYFSSGIDVPKSAQTAAKKGNLSPLERLSTRERQVLQLIVEGNTSVKIAEILSLSPKSVETYRSRMMEKLAINDIPSLVKFAIQHCITPTT